MNEAETHEVVNACLRVLNSPDFRFLRIERDIEAGRCSVRWAELDRAEESWICPQSCGKPCVAACALNKLMKEHAAAYAVAVGDHHRWS